MENSNIMGNRRWDSNGKLITVDHDKNAMSNADFEKFQNGTAPDDAGLNTSGLTIYDDRILVKVEETESKTAGGIIIPDEYKEKKQMAETYAQVISVGRYAFDDMDPKYRPKSGDKVLMSKYAGVYVKGPADGVQYRIVAPVDLVAKVTV